MATRKSNGPASTNLCLVQSRDDISTAVQSAQHALFRTVALLAGASLMVVRPHMSKADQSLGRVARRLTRIASTAASLCNRVVDEADAQRVKAADGAGGYSAAFGSLDVLGGHCRAAIALLDAMEGRDCGKVALHGYDLLRMAEEQIDEAGRCLMFAHDASMKLAKAA